MLRFLPRFSGWPLRASSILAVWSGHGELPAQKMLKGAQSGFRVFAHTFKKGRTPCLRKPQFRENLRLQNPLVRKRPWFRLLANRPTTANACPWRIFGSRPIRSGKPQGNRTAMGSNSGWKPSESCNRHSRSRPISSHVMPYLLADNHQQPWQNQIAHIGCRSRKRHLSPHQDDTNGCSTSS